MKTKIYAIMIGLCACILPGCGADDYQTSALTDSNPTDTSRFKGGPCAKAVAKVEADSKLDGLRSVWYCNDTVSKSDDSWTVDLKDPEVCLVEWQEKPRKIKEQTYPAVHMNMALTDLSNGLDFEIRDLRPINGFFSGRQEKSRVTTTDTTTAGFDKATGRLEVHRFLEGGVPYGKIYNYVVNCKEQ